MNRITQSGIVAGAAALLSGGATVALSDRGSPPAAGGRPLWQTPWIGDTVSPSAVRWSTEPRTATIWTSRRPLVAAVAGPQSNCPTRRAVPFSFAFPLNRPADPAKEVTATLRFRIVRARGWVAGEIAARLNGGSAADIIAVGNAGPQYITLHMDGRTLGALGGVKVWGKLAICGRGGGGGAIWLDSVEVSA